MCTVLVYQLLRELILCSIFVYSHDPNVNVPCMRLGKVEYGTMSDQILMELMIVKVNNNNQFMDDDGEFLDVCQWRGVKCDDKNNVIEINWGYNSNINLNGGAINLSWMPPFVREFNCFYQNLNGTIDTVKLPQCLETLSLSGNMFSGTIDLTQLPKSLERISAYRNHLQGSVDLTQLPTSIKGLYLPNNKLSGSINISHLPHSLKWLYLDNNNIQQEELRVDGELPDRLVIINLCNNHIDRIVDSNGNVLEDGRIRI